MKKILKRIFPEFIVNIGKYCVSSFQLFPEYVYWFGFDIRNSSLFRNEKSDLSLLMITSHVLEKGITMPDRRMGFGYDHVRDIVEKCNYAIKNYSENHIEIQSTLKDLEQYIQLHESVNYELPKDISNGIKELLKYKTTDTIECFESTSKDIFKETTGFYEFAHSRHTVRWYSNEKIEKEILVKAIKLAQTAPSACNRQSTKVYVIDTKEKKEAVLKLQNGNRGFGHLADKILLVTSDMKFWSFKTRTSAYLDAGIFIMNLLYSLHYYKICACTLNAHLSIKNRKRLKSVIGYSKSEMPIVFITIGKAPEKFMVAGSQRLKTDSIYSFI